MKVVVGILLSSFLTCAACDNAKDSPRNLKGLASGNQNTIKDEAAKLGATALSNWSQWRGPLATGEAPNGDPPVDWNETKNIRWKTPLPCQGQGFLLGSRMEASHDPREIPASCRRASQHSPMGSDLTAIVISSVFLGVGFVIAKFFPEAALLAAVFLVGLAILNVALVLVA